jgi:hypothetical protein
MLDLPTNTEASSLAGQPPTEVVLLRQMILDGVESGPSCSAEEVFSELCARYGDDDVDTLA